MTQALGQMVAPRPSRPTPSPNPSGPVQPQDVPDLGDIPLGDGRSRLSIGEGEAVFSTEIEGVPIDLRVDENGLQVGPGPRASPTPRPTPTAQPPGQQRPEF
jgi:penicillin-binding protein 1A